MNYDLFIHSFANRIDCFAISFSDSVVYFKSNRDHFVIVSNLMSVHLTELGLTVIFRFISFSS